MESVKNLPFAESESVWFHLKWNSYVSQRHGLLYVATPKVACTSLKWWFASLEGYAEALRESSLSQETAPDLVIHDSFHQLAPQVTGLPPEALAEPLRSKQFLRFALVRNPFKRVFSAWQSKILLREPLQFDVYSKVDAFNQSIDELSDVPRAFERFLEHLASGGTPASRDAHFIPQADLLRPDLIDYTVLSKIEDTAALRRALRKKLGPEYVDPFAEKHANESLIPYLPKFVSARSAELIRSLFVDDFEIFEYPVKPPPGNGRFSEAQCRVALRAIKMLRGRHQRFAEIRSSHRSQLSTLESERASKLKELGDQIDGYKEQLLQSKTEWDSRAAELEKALLDRGNRTISLNESLIAQVDKGRNLELAMQDKNHQLDRLKRTWEARSAELERIVQDRETRIANLDDELADRNARLLESGQQQSRLENALQESRDLHAKASRDWEERLSELEQTLQGQHEQISQLDRMLAERDLKIGAMESELRAATGVQSELRDELDDATAELSRLIQAKNEAENLNLRMQETRVWRFARKFGLVKLSVNGADSKPRRKFFTPRKFDAAWYLKEYPDIAASGKDPYEHYLTYGRAEGRLPCPPRPHRSRLKTYRRWYTGLASAVRSMGGLRKAVDKVVTVAKRDGWFVEDFDEEFYLRMYPDIRESGVDPYEHFVQHGRAEGRLGRSPDLTIHEGGVPLDPEKKNVLVVSHEASRTGAPILSLNIAKHLQGKFNVIALTLGDGPLKDAFLDVVPLLAGPIPVRGSADVAGDVVAKLAELHDIEFAIVNSIESRFVLKKLAQLSIPSISLVHEFAAYTRPIDAFRFAIRWSSETVFSAQITHDNAVDENPELVGQTFHIIPQGRSTMLAGTTDEKKSALEEKRVMKTLRPGGDLDKDTIVIVGIGYVQYRKGVDLFLECAARVIRSEGGERCRFVWIGNGYDPMADMAYSAYLSEQVQRSGLQQQFTFMKSTSAIEKVYETADILLLSSRLDPLPNVALDAMAHGMPLVCFANTTGVVDALVDCGLTQECVAPYLDTAAMAGLVLDLVKSKDLRKQVGKCMQKTINEKFDMQHYVAGLENLARTAGQRLANEIESTEIILESGLIEPGFFLRPNEKFASPEALVRCGYVRSWSSGIDRRKPFPGFHPGIYREREGIDAPGIDPLASYIRAGQPDGPWNFDVIRSSDDVSKLPTNLRLALHVHAYFPDMLDGMLNRLGMNSVKPDLYISVPDEAAVDIVRKKTRKYAKHVVDVAVVPNVGRDLGPFFTSFGQQFVDRYDIVGHIHTKKSGDIADENTGKVWSDFLFENLLGGKARMADIILGRMASDPTIGMVFPDEPHVVGWGTNLPYAKALGTQLGLDVFPENLVFPVGSMFWARTEAIRPLLELGLDWDDYPKEPLPYDGSMLHAIERIFPLVAEQQSNRIVLTYVDGVTR